MDTTSVDVDALFSGETQFIIPLFQRHYVWTLDDQWEPLWDDIMGKIRQKLSDEHQGQHSPHFTGAIVIQQKTSNVDEVKQYEIIDGQQRLTTFQIILCALRDICKSYGFKKIKIQTERYLRNEGYDSNDEQQYKLIPTDFDKDAFISLIDKSADSGTQTMHEAYGYFKNKIEDYVDRDEQKTRRLFRSIQRDFGFVQILLGSNDEPEKIFESLNARGKPLLQFDLLRNNLFLRARIEEDRDRLYRDYWNHFETPYWETERTVARTKIALSELFFQHFVMAKLGAENVTPLFNVYQRNLAVNNGIEYELSELKRYSEVYQEMTNCSLDSEIGRGMLFYEIFDIATVHPFILFIINELKVSGPEFSKVLHILESYTMRRLLCIRRGTQSYTQFFSRLIRRLKGQSFDLGDFVDLLSNEQANATKWPTDSEVRTFLTLGATPYGVNKNVIRYILYRIELMKRRENPLFETDTLVFDNRLSLEHIMPEKWQKTWSLPLATENEDPIFESKDRIYYKDLFRSEYRANNPEWETEPSEDGLADESYKLSFALADLRSSILQGIGNLTLVTGRHNSSMSNDPFSEKKTSLFQNSLLVMNKEIHGHDIWDFPQINRRTEDLFTYFCSIWPSAKSFIENRACALR